MESFISTGLGIFVSVLLFLIGYKQTIGAKKERIEVANNEVVKILIRRIVNDNYKFNLMDIYRLIEGKARDYKVQMSDLLSVEDILNCIYTRIIETDFITQQQREDIIAKIIPKMDYLDSCKYDETQKPETDNKRSINSQLAIALSLAGIASAIGTLFTTYLSYDTFSKEFSSIIPVLSTTLIISFVLIVFIFILKRIIEKQQEVPISSGSASLENAINFEKEVAKVLKKKFNTVTASGPADKGYDFVIENEGQKILIEVKSWTNPVPNQIIELVVDRLNKSVLDQNALEGIIVTKVPFDTNSIDLNKVRLMTLSELKSKY